MERINGLSYRNMLNYGMRNLNKHRKTVNKLNVFPVPDSDTGTNMVATIRNGLGSVSENCTELSVVSAEFANAVVFGARGNSGVILSQFFRGLSEVFEKLDWADALIFAKALRVGVIRARDAVADPVNGTILTVLDDATKAVEEKADGFCSIDELIITFISSAKKSLDSTPELLPALKNAGVVDSGGAGVVYFFEGIKKYLDGEDIETEDTAEETDMIDYSAYNPDSRFIYGYCSEFLLQLLNSKSRFDYSEFRSRLSELGDSIVISYESDKLKLHIHTTSPGKIMELCQVYGELLFVKIENMTVQHTETVKNILCSEEKTSCSFSIVAAASDRSLQRTFLDMGADTVIYCETTPSAKEFIEAFEMTDNQEIILFPNSSDAIFPAMQAGNLYNKAKVSVINCKSPAECYAALAMIDFCNDNTEEVIESINNTIENVYSIAIVRSNKDKSFLRQGIPKDQYYAFNGKELLATGDNIIPFTRNLIRSTLIKHSDINVITLFYNKHITPVQLKRIISETEDEYVYLEFCEVPCEENSCDLIISFE